MQGGVTLSDYIEPGISRDDAIDVSYGPVGDAFLIFNSGQGYREPVRLTLTPPVSRKEYEDIVTSAKKPLPSRETPPAIVLVRASRLDLTALTRLGEKLRALEAWTPVNPDEEKSTW
jgi:hypothetical protein